MTSSASSMSASLVTTPATSSPDKAEHAAMSAALEQMMKEQAAQISRAYMAAACSAEGNGGQEFVALVNASGDFASARVASGS